MRDNEGPKNAAQEAVGVLGAMNPANLRRALDVTRSCFEIVPKTQAEIAHLVGEPFATANKETQQYLDQFAKAIGDGREAAAATVSDFLASAVASATGAKPSKAVKAG